MLEPMTPEQLAAIRARCEAATAGPWIVLPELCGPDGQGVYHAESMGEICEVGDPYPRGDNRPQENMVFIAAARSDVPALIAEVERLQAQLAARDRELAAAEAFVQAARYLRAGIVTDPQFERGDDLVGWLYTHKDAYERVVEFDHASDLFDAAKGAERD